MTEATARGTGNGGPGPANGLLVWSILPVLATVLTAWAIWVLLGDEQRITSLEGNKSTFDGAVWALAVVAAMNAGALVVVFARRWAHRLAVALLSLAAGTLLVNGFIFEFSFLRSDTNASSIASWALLLDILALVVLGGLYQRASRGGVRSSRAL